MSFVADPAFWFGSGWAFFLGAAMIVGAAFVPSSGFGRAQSNVLIGLILVIPSSTPFPWVCWAALALAIVVWWPSRNRGRWRRALLVCAWTAAFAFELKRTWTPRIDVRFERPATVAVIGDSLTAGLAETKASNWPKALVKLPGVKAVHDFAVAGATCRSALEQAAKVPDDAQIIVVEIGGNDLLGATPLARFERDYDALLAALAKPGRLLVGFELPLPPFHNAWGLGQRRVAAKHGVLLIPKWRLMRILSDPAATTESIHPTQVGQDALFDVVWSVLSSAIRRD